MERQQRTESTVYRGLHHHLATNGVRYVFCHIEV